MLRVSLNHLPYDPVLTELANKLRNKMTPQEKDLWFNFLRGRKPTVYRQRPILRYIVDFYCPASNLVIEIDGYEHGTPEGKEADEDRDDNLKGLGLRILRFTNSEIENEFLKVCGIIGRELNNQS